MGGFALEGFLGVFAVTSDILREFSLHRIENQHLCFFRMNRFDIEALHYHIVVVTRRLVACYQRARGGRADEG